MPTVQEQPETSLRKAPADRTERPYVPASPLWTTKAVVVHAGSRDGYEVGLALSEAGMLEMLVTDFFWPEDRRWSQRLLRFLPASLVSLLKKRSKTALPSEEVHTCFLAGVQGLFLDKLHWLPFAIRQRLTRSADAKLGSVAGTQARRTGAGLLSYSYYAYDAFTAFGRPGVLFQMHPHPATMRRILSDELVRHPECAPSLQKEWELALPESEFQRLCAEPAMASHSLVASSFTRNSLVENGIPAESITVVPYGVDLQYWKPRPKKALLPDSTLRLLFVGRVNQRKGLKYMVEALQLLHGSDIHLTICGRVLHEQDIFKPVLSQLDIRQNVDRDELRHAYQSADLFVFPSVGEGFGQVLLEALACGLPILSTTHTAAPDLIEDGMQGFIVEPRRPDLLAERIAWAATHRRELAEMGGLARQRAERFTWQRFRECTAAAVADALRAPAGRSTTRSTTGGLDV